MKLLISSGSDFEKYTKPYREHIAPYVTLFNEEVAKQSVVGKNSVIDAYSIYLRWPIRKLEYSYVIHEVYKDLKRKVKVLDAACGVSPLVRFFASKGCDVHGVNIDSSILRFLRIRNSLLYDPDVQYLSQDLMNLSFKDETFKLVTCVSVLEHLKPGEDTRAVREMLRVLQKGGRLIMTVDFTTRGMYSLLLRRIDEVEGLILNRNFSKLLEGISSFCRKPERRVKTGIGVYDIDQLYRQILFPFRKHFEGNMIRETRLTIKDIKDFWRSHKLLSCSYPSGSAPLIPSSILKYRKN